MPVAFNVMKDFGGPVVLVLGLMSFVALSVTLFKIVQFAQKKVGRFGVVQKALDRWSDSSLQELSAKLRGREEPLAAVLIYAVVKLERGKSGISQIKEGTIGIAQQQLHDLAKYIRAIDVIAQTAPLLGLFGTVLGMIEAFGKLEEAGATVDPSQLAGGIWVALLTTAVGLAVAIPFSIVVSWLEGRIENERVAMETTMTRFFAEVAEKIPEHSLVNTGVPSSQTAGQQ